MFELQRYEECKTILKASDDSMKEKWSGRLLEAIRDHQAQERDLYKKMVSGPETVKPKQDSNQKTEKSEK